MSLRASYQKLPNITLGRKPKPKLKVVKPLPEHRPGMYLTRSDAELCNKVQEKLRLAAMTNNDLACSVALTDAYRILRDLCQKHNRL